MHLNITMEGPVVKDLTANAGTHIQISGQGTNISHAWWPKNQSIKKKKYCNKLKTFTVVHIKNNLKKKITMEEITWQYNG